MKNIKKSTKIRLFAAMLLIIVAIIAVFSSTASHNARNDESLRDSLFSLLGKEELDDKLKAFENEGLRAYEEAAVPQWDKPVEEQSEEYQQFVSNRNAAFDAFLENFPE